jgi:hypothetical protein
MWRLAFVDEIVDREAHGRPTLRALNHECWRLCGSLGYGWGRLKQGEQGCGELSRVERRVQRVQWRWGEGSGCWQRREMS